MKNALKIGLLYLVCFALLSIGTVAFAYQSVTANAGSDLYLGSGQTATLQGSGYDSNGYSLNYSWTCSGGSLSTYNIAQPVYTAPYSSSQTTYNCTLTVTNSYGNSASDTVIINMNSGSAASYVQTNSATYISNFQANLNSYLYLNNTSYTNYIYFDWGTTTNYGNQTPRQSQNYSGAFFQQIANLTSGTTYHYRAVSTGNYGTVYGQDMTFTTSGVGSGTYGNGTLSISKKVINLTNGNLNWQPSVNANPGDILSFAVTMQAGSYDVHNVVITDILPANLIYKGNLTVNASLSSGNPASGITIGTIPANGVAVISFQAQVASVSNFSFGNTTMTNTATVSSTETGSQTVSASVLMNNTSIAGATIIDTGITNNPIRDSFLLPIMMIILMSWLYFTGRVYRFADWLGARL